MRSPHSLSHLFCKSSANQCPALQRAKLAPSQRLLDTVIKIEIAAEGSLSVAKTGSMNCTQTENQLQYSGPLLTFLKVLHSETVSNIGRLCTNFDLILVLIR